MRSIIMKYTYLFLIILIFLFVAILGIVSIFSNYDELREDFCSERGWDYAQSSTECYKVNDDTIISKSIVKYDGEIYWREVLQ